MSSPRSSRGWDINAGPSNYRIRSPSRSRRSSSSVRRPRNESFSSLLPYDPDAYTEDLIPQDVIFDGPSASSVPTSVSQFAHRGSRASFGAEEDRLRFFAVDFDSDAEDALTEVDSEEEDRHSMLSSRISDVSSVAVLPPPDVESGRDQFPLIRRKSTDQRSDVGSTSGRGRSTQKIYLADEDMVVVMSGFRTRRGRLWIYRLLCLSTLGMVYLLMRWLPRWRLTFLAEPVPLSEAHWVVVEVPILDSLF
jgi:cation-transporting ATPase 13A3/4/5